MSRDLDHLDHEHIEDTLRSLGYEIIRDRITDELTRKTRELIVSGENPELNRGMILGLELALRIPSIVADESRGKAVK